VELSEKTVGIVGLGRIGVLVAQRLSAFGVKLIAYDPYVQPARAAQIGVRLVPLDELMRESDFITVHLPKTAETAGLIGDEQLKLAKPTMYLVNAARGGIVDEDALYRAISEGRVAGAGLDVYAKEPCTDSPLFGLETVVATPHLGASTDEAQEKAGISVAKSVRLALAGELVPDAVNVQGGILAEPIRPLLPVAERLGAIASGLADGAVQRIDVEVRGEVADLDVRVLELGALKGLIQGLVHDPVSYVNAPVLAQQRGVEVALTTDKDSDDHRNLVRVRLTLSDGAWVSVAGTVSGPKDVAKLVEVDRFDVDVPISEHMVFFRYHDRPGVVGTVGRILGEADVNIGGMQVSREESGEHSVIVLTVDQAVPADVLERIVSEIGAHTGRAVDLAF
jgi:D-3-phosphoglycerate dehydrogenase